MKYQTPQEHVYDIRRRAGAIGALVSLAVGIPLLIWIWFR